MNDAAATETKKLFKVPAENLEKLQRQVEDVNKRVARLTKKGYQGVLPIVIEVGEMYAVQKIDLDGIKYTQVYAPVTLVSPKPPKIEGWEFVAALTHIEDAGTVLRVVPGVVVAEGELKGYREAESSNCDHCETNRRRNDTFIVRNPQGDLKQVGRQCLASYTGIKNPEWLCAGAEILFSASAMLDASEEEGGFGGGVRYATIAEYLPFVACSVRTDGWLSRGEAYKQNRTEQATASIACSRGVYSKPGDKYRLQPEERDYNTASAIINFVAEYFEGKEVADLSDYENSMRVSMASPILHPKLTGIVASAIQFYNKDLERRARNESWAKMVAGSEFQGAIGERRIFENLKVVGYRTWESQFGVTHFYTFIADDTHCITYFASRDMDLAIGQTLSLKATVKKHEFYAPKSGAPAYKQTTVTRGALVAKAVLVAQSVVEKQEYKVQVEGSKQGEFPIISPVYGMVPVSYAAYHLVAEDGRKFVSVMKKAKKALKVGGVHFVEFLSDSRLPPGTEECPCSIAI